MRINKGRNWLMVEKLVLRGRYEIVDNNLITRDGEDRDDDTALAMCLPDPKHTEVVNLDVGDKQSAAAKALKISLWMRVGEVTFDFSTGEHLLILAPSFAKIKEALAQIRFRSYCPGSI
jgi:hypothetical protein